MSVNFSLLLANNTLKYLDSYVDIIYILVCSQDTNNRRECGKIISDAFVMINWLVYVFARNATRCEVNNKILLRLCIVGLEYFLFFISTIHHIGY